MRRTARAREPSCCRKVAIAVTRCFSSRSVVSSVVLNVKLYSSAGALADAVVEQVPTPFSGALDAQVASREGSASHTRAHLPTAPGASVVEIGITSRDSRVLCNPFRARRETDLSLSLMWYAEWLDLRTVRADRVGQPLPLRSGTAALTGEMVERELLSRFRAAPAGSALSPPHLVLCIPGV